MSTTKIGSFQHKRGGTTHLGIVNEGYRKVATMAKSDTHEDARLAYEIVRRYNAHDALVEALERAKDHMVMSEGAFICDGSVHYSRDHKEALEQVCQALNAAKAQ